MNNSIKSDLSTFDNSAYKPGGLLKRLSWYVVSLLFVHSYFPTPIFFKKIILLIFGAKIGKNFVIKPSVNIKYPWFLKIGDNVWIGEKVWIDNLEFTTIGDNVCLSQNAFLLTGNHNYSVSNFELTAQGITLEDGVWIGANAVVCPGVVCKSHSVLVVGSVATKMLEPFSIYQGNPAIKIKSRVLNQ